MQAEQYEVEEILEERTYAKGSTVVTEYKVKWKGYPHEEATWEPIQNLDNCKEVVKRYQEKKMAKKVPKQQKTKSKEKPIPQPKTQMNPMSQEKPVKDIVTTNRNDFYFSDESNVNEEKRMDVQFPQDQPQQSIELGEKTEEQAERSVVKGKRGRKKKEKQEEPLQKSKSLKDLVKMEPNKPIEPITHKILQKVLFQQIPVRRPVRTDQFTLSSKSTQTSLQSRSDLGVKVVSMHTSIEFPGKLWFTVEQQGKFMEVSHQKLIMSDSKALYNFYHKHYLKGKNKSASMQAAMLQILNQQIVGKTDEESDSEENFSVLDYFSIAQQYGTKDSESRSKFQRLIRSVTVKPKTDKCLI